MNETSEAKGNLVIGEGVVITGSIEVPGKAVINGVLNGELQADELEVGREGRITGKIIVNKADVRGAVHESLQSRDSLILRSTGRIHGMATYGEIEVERGGQVKGTIAPTPTDIPPAPATNSPAPDGAGGPPNTLDQN